MGDRIAILEKGGVLAQYATPAELLMTPASEFVADFVGADRALKRLRLVLEATADRAMVRGRPMAIQFLPDGYRFEALDPDDNWRPLIDPPVFTERTLPGELGWAGLRLDGQPDATSLRLQFGSQAPEYELRVSTPAGEARFTGKANGDVILAMPGRTRS